MLICLIALMYSSSSRLSKNGVAYKKNSCNLSLCKFDLLDLPEQRGFNKCTAMIPIIFITTLFKNIYQVLNS